MPGGYGTINTPWGAGGTTSQPGSYSAPGGQSVQQGSNAVAQAANDVQQAKQLGVNDKGQTVQEAQASFANTLAQSGQSSAPAMVQGIINAQNAQAAAAQAAVEEEKKKKTGIFGSTLTSGQNLLSQLSPLAGVLRGAQSTDRFFKNLQASKGGRNLSPRDLVTLANLINAKNFPLQYLEDYAKKNNLSESETRDLAKKFTRAHSDLESKVFESGIMNYLDTKPEGFKDSLSAMFGQYEGDQVPGAKWGFDPHWAAEQKENYEKYMKLYEETKDEKYLDYALYELEPVDAMVDRPTLQDVTSRLGTEGLEYLKGMNPNAYYMLRPPQTSGSIAELAGETTFTGENLTQQEKDFNQQIFDARAELDRMQHAKDLAGGGGGGAGITGLPGIPGIPDIVLTDPVPEPEVTPPGITFAPGPFDYLQWPQYMQQGIASPNLNPWYNTLQNYYGVV